MITREEKEHMKKQGKIILFVIEMLLNFLYDHMYPYPGVKCIRNKSKGETIMVDMQFAKYSCDIREILGNMTEKDQFANLVRNAVAYAISNSSSQTNWIARELFIDVIPEELISEIFDK